jgi:hypothetical protein
VRMTQLLPTAAEVRALKKEQLGFCILEWLNDEEVASVRQGYGDYRVHQQNFLNGIQQSYRDNDAIDAFSGAWQWIIQEGYISVFPSPDIGWYRLTPKGRQIKKHDQWKERGVVHDVPTGQAPNFGAAVPDARLSGHLEILWNEADLAYKGGAYLATVVMLGSLLEGVLLAKAQANQAAAQGATTAPKDSAARVRALDKWRLVNLIEVASELGWIQKTRADFSDIVRDYRNLVHPWKAATTGKNIDKGTAGIAWKVVVETLRDLGISS